jgi:hypothetical protein
MIEIKCRGADYLSIEELEEFQHELKTLPTKSRDRLKKSIERQGFIAPIFVWKHGEHNKIIDGHQRLKTLKWMQEKHGYEVPKLPVAYIQAETEQEAKERLLSITSQYGEFDTEALNDWVESVDVSVRDLFRFVEKEIDLDKDGNVYTAKIEAPIYEPKNEKPDIKQLCNTEKADQLIQKINDADIPGAVKDFLRLAAFRHVVFDYSLIADYYAHSDDKIQQLFEDSALVIIDFKGALKGGYLRLSKEILDQYKKDYEIE